MSETMVEKVAEAIGEALYKTFWQGACDATRRAQTEERIAVSTIMARAAIAAMREPTEAMVGAAERLVTEGEAFAGDARAEWSAMVDAALQEDRR